MSPPPPPQLRATLQPEGRGRFGRSDGARVLEDDGEGGDAGDLPEGDLSLSGTAAEDELDAVEHDTLVAVQQEKLTAENPCRNCGGSGHWSRDPECPKNTGKQAASANVTMPASC